MKKIALWPVLLFPVFVIAQGSADGKQDPKTGVEQNNITLSGKVVNERTKHPLPGATVHIKGTTHEVITDENGEFHFLTGQKLPVVYVVSYVGFAPQEVPATQSSGIQVRLRESGTQLNDVVVVAYGTSRRKDLVGAVTKINPSETKNIPAGSFEAQLQGKAPGVQFTTTTGVPGEVVTVRLRGATSINADNTPLYVVDGVFVNSNSLQSLNTGGKATSPIADINPNDIESVEVLKDAEAEALYGSRGANGVIIVTTKRSNFNQKTQVTADISQGVAWAPPLWKLTTGPEHATLVNENWANTGGTFATRPFRPVSEGGRGLPEEQKTYDRLGEAFHHASLANYNLSVFGGTNGTRFYIGAGYNKQESILKPITFERASLKANIDQKLGQHVTVGISNTITRTYRNQGRAGDGPQGGILQAALHTPTYLSPYNDQGVLVGRAGFDNLTLLLQYYDVHATSIRYIGNAYIEAELFKNLKFRSSWGVDYNNYDESEYWNTYLIAGSPSGFASSTITQNASWVNEQTLSWRKKIGGSSFGILVGNTLQSNTAKGTHLEGRGFPNNSFKLISSASTITGSQTWTQNTLSSFFGKADYNYSDRYLVNVSLRADGSSKFGPNRKWGYFPAVGLAWRAKQESFLRNVKALNDLKIRVSYGITGNQNGIGDFASQGLWGAGNPYKDSSSISPQQLANADLHWERTSQFNIGADVSLFEGRISLDLNYYYKYTSDGLLQLPLANTTGFSSVWKNAAEISNRGFEVGINTINIRTEHFSWSTSFNVARNLNRIEKLPTAAPLQYGSRNLIIMKEGSPMYSFFLYKQLYVDPQTGNAVYQDLNKDGKTTTADLQVLGSIWPKFFGGIGNNFSYNNFDLNIFFSYQYGNKTYNHNRFFGEGGGARDANRIIFASNLARWQKPGDITDVPKPDGINVNNYLDDGGRWLEDGGFLRLRTLTLGYTVPKTFTRKIGIDNIRLYVVGSNLFLVTKYTGPDPESAANSNQNQPGIDLGTPPQPRSIQFGINVGL